MRITEAQRFFLRLAVSEGWVCAWHHAQRLPVQRLVELGLLTRLPDEKDFPYPLPRYRATARGRAYLHWYRARHDRPVRAFPDPSGGELRLRKH